MRKITAKLTIFLIFLSFPLGVFAAQDFDYFFGRLLVSTASVVPIAPAQVVSAQAPVNQNPNLNQMASMQRNLDQMKATLAALNSSLSKSSGINSALAVKKSSEIAVARGIPLLLTEPKKEEKSSFSVFASLVPPDVRNFPFIFTFLVIFTLSIFGVILYLYLNRRQARKLI